MSVPRFKTPRDPRESQLISSYDSTSGVSPDAPAGGGGPGRFTSRKPHGFASAIPFQSKTGPRAAKESVLVAGLNESFDDIGKTAKEVISGVIEIKKGAKNVVLAYYLARDKYIWQMVLEETGRSLKELLGGLIPALLTMLIVVAASTVLGATVGALIGALFGGVGAVPGAAIGAKTGFEFGVFVLTWLGIGFLIVYIGKHLGEVITHISAGVERAWYAGKRLQPEKTDVEEAAKEMARGIAVLFRLILEGIVMYLLAKGAAAVAQRLPKLVEGLKNSKLGKGFAEWIEKNHKSLIEDPKTNPQLRRTAQAEEGKGAPKSSEGARSGPTAQRTKPSGGQLTGKVKQRPKDKNPENVRAYKRENESAEILDRAGYKVERNPPKLPNGKEPDYKIEGEYFDCYAPSSSRARNIHYNIKNDKVMVEQTDRIVLNLEDSNVPLAELKKQFTEYPIEGLKEIIVIKNGSVIEFYP